MEEEDNKPLFTDINADSFDSGITEVESLCLACHEKGTTRLLLTRIPFFKEIIVSSFECPHCFRKDNEVQSAGAIQDKGCKITLRVKTIEDINRQLVKTDYASMSIPELGFEIPPFTQKGVLTTIEGLLTRAIDGLNQEQPVRRIMDQKLAEDIDAFIEKLRKCLTVEFPFTFILNDMTGNSFLENPFAPKDDPEMIISRYKRTREQEIRIGMRADDEEDGDAEEGVEEKTPQTIGKEEILSIDSNCLSCLSPCPMRIKPVKIPHFKEVIILATSCDKCGYRSNEVKSGAGIEPKGTKITLRITDISDLSRDVLKSDTCGLEVPAIDFVLHPGTLGGRFTTLEGLLSNARDQLVSIHPFSFGDSGKDSFADNMKTFVDKINKVISGEMMGITVMLDDPAGNSYLQNTYAPDEDPELIIEHYERTQEQNDELGISDMITENY